MKKYFASILTLSNANKIFSRHTFSAVFFCAFSNYTISQANANDADAYFNGLLAHENFKLSGAGNQCPLSQSVLPKLVESAFFRISASDSFNALSRACKKNPNAELKRLGVDAVKVENLKFFDDLLGNCLDKKSYDTFYKYIKENNTRLDFCETNFYNKSLADEVTVLRRWDAARKQIAN